MLWNNKKGTRIGLFLRLSPFSASSFNVWPFPLLLFFLCVFDLKGMLLIGETRNAFLKFWVNDAVTAAAGELRPNETFVKMIVPCANGKCLLKGMFSTTQKDKLIHLELKMLHCSWWVYCMVFV